MTPTRMMEVVEVYKRRLSEVGPDDSDACVVPERFGVHHSTDRLNHLMWMLFEIEKHVENQKLEKANRWLGFVQGCLWYEGIYSIDEMRAHNAQEKDAD